jgi:hypothetical protein
VRTVTVDERDRDRVDRFVLGTATEDERRQVEDRLFADDEVLALLQDREDALFDDYAHGRLGEADRASFERHRLATAGGRERLAFARAAARLTPAAAPARRWRPAWLPVAASVVLAVATAVLGVRTLEMARERKADQARFETRERELQALLDAERRRAATPVAVPSPALALRSDGTRAGGDTPELRMPARTSTVVIAVPRPPGPERASYQVVLRTAEGELVWEDAGLHPDDRQILLTVPGAVLRPGDFILTLSGRGATGPAAELADHYFRITPD